MNIEIPEFSLVILIGASSSGKTTFAHKHFLQSEVLSSDKFREIVSDNENDQSCSKDAFDILYYIAHKRLVNRKLTVIDATNTNPQTRNDLLKIAKDHDAKVCAIILNLPEKTILDNFENRSDKRSIDVSDILIQIKKVKRVIKDITKSNGYRNIYEITSLDQLNDISITRTKLTNNLMDEHSSLDIIGDVHGCFDELVQLLTNLGYDLEGNHKDNRKLVFIGDLCDRGPKSLQTLDLVMKLVANNKAYCIQGNHEFKLSSKLKSIKDIDLTNINNSTLLELKDKPEDYIEKINTFIKALRSYYVFDDGNLVVSHAGIKEDYILRSSGRIRTFCLFGDIKDGEVDEYGLPVRNHWEANYKGKALNIFGHTPNKNVIIQNNTYNIDTGCVFGGMLTAFRYPEKELVSVKALQTYVEPIKPLDSYIKDNEDSLDANSFINDMNINTSLIPVIDIKKNQTYDAMEIISKWSIDPKWLIYLPPTMSPCATSILDDYLEYPTEAFDYYIKNNVIQVVCEKKHMGSRAIIVLCKDLQTVKERFRIDTGDIGTIYTRNGFPFFPKNKEVETTILSRLHKVLTETNFWNDFNTNWVCIDSELMPWSDKAKGLLSSQYAPIGKSGVGGISKVIDNLNKFNSRNDISEELRTKVNGIKQYEGEKLEHIKLYIKAYEAYCWPVNSIEDYKIAPFHIMATNNSINTDKTNIWHMQTIKKYIANNSDPIFIETPNILVNVTDKVEIDKATNWWKDLTNYENKGEGMVVKPLNFFSYNNNQIIQPAIKCRGREYLRIIYGPDYITNLKRLKNRSLSRKRQLAVKEFVLGIESLERFNNKESLQRIHECVFGILSLESDFVDPRL